MNEKASPELIAEILSPTPVKTEPHTPYFIFILSLFLFPPLTCYFIYKYPYYYKWAVYLLWLSAFSSLIGLLQTLFIAPKLEPLYGELGSGSPPGFFWINILLIFTVVIQIIMALYLRRKITVSSPDIKKYLILTFIILAFGLSVSGFAVSQAMTQLLTPLYNYTG
jgi:hypothetical protein